MPEYEKLYTALFNAITDALEQLAHQNYGLAAEALRRAQCEAEERYLSTAE